MNFIKAVQRPFLDVKKLIIGILLSIVPIVDFFALGYILDATKGAVGKKPKYDLPEWTRFGDLFVKGLLSMVAIFVYSIPLWILMLLMGATVMGSPFKQGMGMGVTSLFGASVFMLAIACVVGLLGLLLAYIMPAAIVNFAVKGKFGAAFELSLILKKALTGKYLVAWVCAVLYAMLVSFLLSWMPWVGGAAASFIIGITSLTLVAEAY